jgi:hypothetical protein
MIFVFYNNEEFCSYSVDQKYGEEKDGYLSFSKAIIGYNRESERNPFYHGEKKR